MKNVITLRKIFNFFIFIYIFLSKIEISFSECNIDNPFKKDNICVSSCLDSEINSGECIIDNSIIKIQWLNNIFVFDSNHFRAGHFAFNINGDMFIEYSYDKYRLFFGLKKNGKFYFKDNNENEIPTKMIILEGSDYKRYESKNIFISLKNNTKEYLFSTGEDKTISELYNLDTNEYKINKTQNFFGNTLSSSVFTILDLNHNNSKEYLIAYIYDKSYVLQKFNLTDFILYSTEKKNSESITLSFYNRIISCYIIDSLKIIIFFYINNNNNNIYNIYYYYSINIYDFNFNILKNNIVITEEISKNSFVDNHGMFSKCLSIKDTLGFFIYYKTMYSNSLQLTIGNIDKNNYTFSVIFKKDFNNYSFDTSILLNDLVKINDERFAFISISSNDPTIFYILLFDLYNEYTQMKIRVYKSKLYKYKIDKELEASLYNNHLVLSLTILKNEDNVPFSYKYDDYYYSIFFILGYTNETDNIINISDYLFDGKNIVTELTKNVTIDNNIFGYEVVYDKIKLVTIPDEMIFYNKNNENKKINNGDILDKNYKFEENINIIKTDKYYSLEYQPIIQEPNYVKFNSYAIDIIDCQSLNNIFEDQDKYFNPKMIFGRINKAIFKLCFDFCSSCKNYGTTIIDQKCESCLTDYDYYYPKISSSNCVPFNHYIEDTGEIVECNRDNSKFYKDESNNKIICFKKDLICPDDYPFLIHKSYECKDSCLYQDLLAKECSLPKINYIIHKETLEDIIFSYPYDGESLVIEGEDEYVFQLTNSLNEMNTFEGKYTNEYNLSMIDLCECEYLLKQKYHINNNIPLIIIKYEKIINEASEKNVQYEIYHPINKTKLDLSICKDSYMNLYIPVTLNEKTQSLYEDLEEYGYNLFDINDSFYQDICTPYKSENGTDVLLSDRKKDFYSNETKCQNNCQYSNYSLEKQYLKCECSIDNKDIQSDKFDTKIIFTSFYEVLKYSNFHVLKCYKLVFNLYFITDNYGSIILIIFFLIYLFFIFIFIFKGISPLKVQLFREISKKCNNKEILKHSPFNLNKIKKKTENEKTKSKFLRRKINNKTSVINNNIKNNVKRINIKNNSKTNRKIIINSNKMHLSLSPNNKANNSKVTLNNFTKKLNNKKLKNEKEKLDDFELNELEYLEAIKFDKRSFNKIYWSFLKRNHIILFTFFSWNDYNLPYIKFAKFIFLISSDMAMNIFFFTDDSMHKIYLNYGKYNFIQHIPKIIYSTIVSQILEFFLCYLCLTDKHIYQVKRIKDYTNYINFIFQIINVVKFKLIFFFIITLNLFGFYWYFISAFCAVYKNTQIIFINDSISSFFINLINPIFVSLIPVILRIIAIKDEKKSLKCLYQLSDFISIF